MPFNGFPLPLTRFNTLFPGQLGVRGTSTKTGLRMHTSGAVFWVDPNHPDAQAQGDGTDPEHPLSSIQVACDQAVRGDVVAVMENDAWQYASGLAYALPVQESVIVTSPGISILGFARSGLGVIWQPAAALGTCLTLRNIDVHVAGFGFDAPLGGNGIYVEWDGATMWGENTVIQDCFFSDTIDIAVQLEYAWNCWIQRCVFQECDAQGLYIDPAGSGAAYLHVLQNRFNNCAAAMAVNGLDDSEILSNRIFNANAQGGGAATDEGIDTTAGSTNLVADNWLSCLLPVPAAGDYDDFCTAAATDAWINNHCLDGDTVTNPT